MSNSKLCFSVWTSVPAYRAPLEGHNACTDGENGLTAIAECCASSYCSVFLYLHTHTCLYESGHHGVKKVVEGEI